MYDWIDKKYNKKKEPEYLPSRLLTNPCNVFRQAASLTGASIGSGSWFRIRVLRARAIASMSAMMRPTWLPSSAAPSRFAATSTSTNPSNARIAFATLRVAFLSVYFSSSGSSPVRCAYSASSSAWVRLSPERNEPQ